MRPYVQFQAPQTTKNKTQPNPGELEPWVLGRGSVRRNLLTDTLQVHTASSGSLWLQAEQLVRLPQGHDKASF